MKAYYYYVAQETGEGVLFRKDDVDQLIKAGKFRPELYTLRFTLLARNDQDAESRLQNMLRNSQ